jgi:hypothetical protein
VATFPLFRSKVSCPFPLLPVADQLLKSLIYKVELASKNVAAVRDSHASSVPFKIPELMAANAFVRYAQKAVTLILTTEDLPRKSLDGPILDVFGILTTALQQVDKNGVTAATNEIADAMTLALKEADPAVCKHVKDSQWKSLSRAFTNGVTQQATSNQRATRDARPAREPTTYRERTQYRERAAPTSSSPPLTMDMLHRLMSAPPSSSASGIGGGGRPTCSHCGMLGHHVTTCFKLNPHMDNRGERRPA